jgi:glycosyltransferase involved in cell wall biosynthesis
MAGVGASHGQYANRGEKGVMPNSAVVTFVIPCYKLAHYLDECIQSIGKQSYRSVELMIINDASPDNTEQVATSIIQKNPGLNIKYIANERNLGNIRTYNLGIRLATGKYVWILSPDDRLRSPEIVQRYVTAMQADPEVGYAFCPGHTLEGEVDAGIRIGTRYLTEDRIVDGKQLARDIVSNNFELLAPSVMIRKSCYEGISMFPVDLPHRGDGYVWALIAMQHKVAFFAEPMVDYRVHAGSMMSTLARTAMHQIMADDIGFPSRAKAEANRRGLTELADHCRSVVIAAYVRCLVRAEFRGHAGRMSFMQFEASLRSLEASPEERLRIRLAVLKGLAFKALSPRRWVNLGRRITGFGTLRRS